jgi:hypothetical protein
MSDTLQAHASAHTLTVPSAAPARPVTDEIATIKRDLLRTTFGIVLTNEDDTLLTRGGAKGLKIYDELERDCQAGSVLNKRKLAVIARPWVVDAASDSAADVAAADLVRSALEALKFDRICYELLDAVLKGYAVGEVIWELRDGKVLPRDVKPKNQRRFVFDEDEQLRMRTRERPLEGEELPPRKFVVHRFGAKDGSPYGLGVGRSLFWPVFFKRQDITFWLTFADKFGSPTSLGKYPNGTDKAGQAKLLQVLQAIANDAGVIIPEGMVVELLEAERSGSADTYERLARYMDEQISLAVLGETMTTNAQAAGLGSGQANVHNQVRVELSKADGDLLSDTLNDTLVRWIVEYNMPGAALPKVRRDFAEPEDMVARSTRDKNLVDMGFEPDDEYVATTYGEGWRRKAQPEMDPALLALGNLGTPAARPGDADEGGREEGTELANGTGDADAPSYAEGRPLQQALGRSPQAARQHELHSEAMQAIDSASSALATQWKQLVGQQVGDLVSLAEETGDLVEFREKLTQLMLAPPPQATVDAIARATFAGSLLGRLSAPKPSKLADLKAGFKAGVKKLTGRGAR